MSKDHLSPTMSKEDEMGQDDLNFLFIFFTSILEVITIFASKLKAKLQKGISQNTNMLAVFSGHVHHIFGAESQDIAFGFYATNPFLAIAIEAVFTVVTLSYFFKKDAQLGIIRTQKNKAAIIGLFVFGVLFMLSIATTSFRELFGLPDFNLGFNSNVPTLIMTYVGMILYLNHFVPKFKTETKSL
jgi:hypothetical protein